MSTIFSYRVRWDCGSAPNPFWDVCTLVLCKARIRRAAQSGDWVIGFGSAQSPVGDLSGRVVFVMQVTQVMSMQAYDAYAQQTLPGKILDRYHADPKRRVGDAIYDFSTEPSTQRPGVHDKERQEEDLSGKNALLSDHFWYYGRDAIAAPDAIQPLNPPGVGYRSRANDAYLAAFLHWIKTLESQPSGRIGYPAGFNGKKDCHPLEKQR